MKISKYLQSCLLVEEQGKVILLDPGIFTYNEKALDVGLLSQLDYILITHSHPDHTSVPLIKELIAKFPHVSIITNQEAVELLAKEGISSTTAGNEIIKIASANHEKVWDHKPPQNTIFTLFNRFTHPGDSLSFQSTAKILALPIQAPWGSTTWAVETALKLKPKVIIPIHDYMWKEDFRKAMYERLAGFFKQHNIDFKPLETAEVIELKITF